MVVEDRHLIAARAFITKRLSELSLEEADLLRRLTDLDTQYARSKSPTKRKELEAERRKILESIVDLTRIRLNMEASKELWLREFKKSCERKP